MVDGSHGHIFSEGLLGEVRVQYLHAGLAESLVRNHLHYQLPILLQCHKPFNHILLFHADLNLKHLGQNYDPFNVFGALDGA